ncbi:bifunctional (p)ppGpp synthetase/guanosine-3',5'-bis(diphosphate) 3'-pyrophosphohydrolase [Candidatus Woesebacteria bacterium]|nr:MAG: bifunctional (p)ppGpp synthetase/guanosine-3',5'-bis(diphosphate) 3'-pyrophosphohydrolase [Candidatus Woesebacteria bacterium]
MTAESTAPPSAKKKLSPTEIDVRRLLNEAARMGSSSNLENLGPFDYPEEALLPPTGITTEEIKQKAFVYIRMQVDNPDELIDKLNQAGDFAQDKLIKAGKEKRKSDDETQTHHWWMVYYLLRLGITDEDAICATVLHDIYEDTDTSLDEITEATNKNVSNIVDALTKIRKKEDVKGKPRQTQISYWNEEETQTVFKLLGSLNSEQQVAVIIKTVGDVVHNALTYEHLPRNKSIEKATLAVELYYKLAIRLGAFNAADLIGNASFRSLNPQEYARLTAMQHIVDNALIGSINDELDRLVSTARVDNMRIPYSAIAIETQTPLEVYLANHNPTEENMLPEVYIICDTTTSVLQWKHYLGEQESFKPHKGETPSLPFSHEGKTHRLRVHVFHQEDLVNPLDNFRGIHTNNPDLATGALKKLADIARYTDQLQKNGDPHIELLTEGLGRGTINIETPTGEILTVASGATALDAAYAIGRNLGNDATKVTIIQGNNKYEGLPLNTSLKPGDKVWFEVAEGSKGRNIVFPDRLDMVTTGKAINNITRRLEQLTDDAIYGPEIRTRAIIRGTRMIEKTYSGKVSDNPNLPKEPILIFQKMDAGFADIAHQVGIHVPINTESDHYMEEWHDLYGFNPQLAMADRFVDDVIDRTLECPHFRIVTEEKAGVMKIIGESADKCGISFVPIVSPDNSPQSNQFNGGKYILDIWVIEGNDVNALITTLLINNPKLQVTRVDNNTGESSPVNTRNAQQLRLRQKMPQKHKIN